MGARPLLEPCAWTLLERWAQSECRTTRGTLIEPHGSCVPAQWLSPKSNVLPTLLEPWARPPFLCSSRALLEARLATSERSPPCLLAAH
eukprot:3918161-Prymnesium_polylepis.1